MNTDNIVLKDLDFSVGDLNCKIRNVPYNCYDAEGEYFIDLGNAIKIEMIRELMMNKDIPLDIDFNLVKDIIF